MVRAPVVSAALVWTEAQKVRFIESCWNGPHRVFVWNEAYGTRYDQWLLDGQQRISAVLGYMADKFPVFGYRFSELTEVDLRRWDMGVQFPCLKPTSPTRTSCGTFTTDYRRL